MDGRKKVGDSPVERHRKQRLRALIREHLVEGGAASLARKANRTQASVSHLSLPGYPFGRRAARALEGDLALKAGYFDEGYGTTKQIVIPLVSDGVTIDDTVRLSLPKDDIPIDKAIAILLPENSRAVAVIVPGSAPGPGRALLVRCRDTGVLVVAKLEVLAGQLCLLPLDLTVPSFAVHPNIEFLGSVIGIWTKYAPGTEQSTM